jgi:hypothetical protein
MVGVVHQLPPPPPTLFLAVGTSQPLPHQVPCACASGLVFWFVEGWRSAPMLHPGNAGNADPRSALFPPPPHHDLCVSTGPVKSVRLVDPKDPATATSRSAIVDMTSVNDAVTVVVKLHNQDSVRVCFAHTRHSP